MVIKINLDVEKCNFFHNETRMKCHFKYLFKKTETNSHRIEIETSSVLFALFPLQYTQINYNMLFLEIVHQFAYTCNYFGANV